jgi:hypothetical protein
MDDEPVRREADWKPKWTVDIDGTDTLGIAIDDGCFVVLYRHGNSWRPGTHIPKEVANRIAELVEAGELN